MNTWTWWQDGENNEMKICRTEERLERKHKWPLVIIRTDVNPNSPAKVGRPLIRFLPVRCYWVRLRWGCIHCSTRWLDTRNTAGSPTGSAIQTGSPSVVSSWSHQWKVFLKGPGFLFTIRYMISVFGSRKEEHLTSYMCKSTKWSSGTVSILPHVIAFGGFVDLGAQTKGQRFKSGKVDTVSSRVAEAEPPHLWVKLLLSARVTILTAVSAVTLWWFAPLITVFHTWTRCRPVAIVTVLLQWRRWMKPDFRHIQKGTYLYLNFLGFRLRSLLLW